MNDNIELPKTNKEDNIIEESKNMVKKDVKSFKIFFKDVKEYLTSRNTSELGELVWRLVLIAIVVIVLYVPFQLFRDIGINIIISVGINFSDKTLNMYNSIFNIIYSIFGIVLFFVLCKDRFYKVVKNQEEIKGKQN